MILDALALRALRCLDAEQAHRAAIAALRRRLGTDEPAGRGTPAEKDDAR